jgi:hypothetical protein
MWLELLPGWRCVTGKFAGRLPSGHHAGWEYRSGGFVGVLIEDDASVEHREVKKGTASPP